MATSAPSESPLPENEKKEHPTSPSCGLMELEFGFGSEHQHKPKLSQRAEIHPVLLPAQQGTSQPGCQKCPSPAQPAQPNPCLESPQGPQTQNQPGAGPAVSRG